MFGYAYVNGNKLIRLYAEKYETYGIVDSIKSKSIKLDTSINSAFAAENTIKVDEDDYDYFFTKNGKGIDVKDIKEDDLEKRLEDIFNILLNVKGVYNVRRVIH